MCLNKKQLWRNIVQIDIFISDLVEKVCLILDLVHAFDLVPREARHADQSLMMKTQREPMMLRSIAPSTRRTCENSAAALVK